MEKIVFSKPKLALAVVTAPRQAFEEISERKLLGSAFVITAVTGLLALVLNLIGYLRGTASVFDLARYNPVTWVAYLLVVSFGAQLLTKFLGGKGNLSDTVTGLGWTNIVGALFWIVLIIEQFAPQLGGLSTFMQVWSLVVFVFAIDAVHQLGIVKSASISLLGLFPVAILEAVGSGIAASANPQLNILKSPAATRPIAEPIYLWGIAILAGVAVYLLLRQIEWRKDQRLPFAAGSFALVGLLAGWITLTSAKLDLIDNLKTARSAYESGRYALAEEKFDKVLRVFPNDFQAGIYQGHTYLVSGRFKAADMQFRDMIEGPRAYASGMDAVRVFTGLGAVKYAAADYKQAVAQFDKALEQWPNYREAHSRKALALVRMNKLDEARKAAEEALDSGADSAIPYVALAQVYSLQGDAKKAKDNFGMVTAINPDLADKIGRSPENWKNAVERIPPDLLKYPFETEPSKVVPKDLPKSQQPRPKFPFPFSRQPGK